jgi:hypothetical protein
MGVVAVPDAVCPAAEDLDRRFRDALVIAHGASLARVPQLTRFLLAGLDVRPRLDAGELAGRVDADAGPERNGLVGPPMPWAPLPVGLVASLLGSVDAGGILAFPRKEERMS